jgi:hypothetical protein
VVYGPNRVGSGRIDALAALQNSVLAYAQAGSGVVSASFGVVEVAQDKATATRTVTLANKGETTATYKASYAVAADQPGVSYAITPDEVTVPAGGTTTVTVTMTAVRDQLRRTADPTVDISSGRQFVGEESGRLEFTPTTGDAPTLRVPVHSNAKPSSTLTAKADSKGQTITLSGRGVGNGEPGKPSSYVSLASVFEQLGTDPVMPKCQDAVSPDCYKTELERSVDLASVGVASDALTAKRADAGLYVAVAAHGKATSPETAVNYGVYIDANGDRQWDYQVTTTRIKDFDLPVVVVTDRQFNLLPKGAPVATPLDLYEGNVDTNLFDTDVQVLAAPLSAMPLIGAVGTGPGRGNSASRITLGVQSISYNGTVDDLGTVTGPTGGAELAPQAMSFDPLAPGLSFTGQDGAPAIGVPAANGTAFTVRQDTPSYQKDTAVGGGKGALVVLSHNDTATGRALSLPLGPARSGPPGQP